MSTANEPRAAAVKALVSSPKPPPASEPRATWVMTNPKPVVPVTSNEHLRVIRCYLGWLLVIAATPIVLTGIALVLWLIRWISQ